MRPFLALSLALLLSPGCGPSDGQRTAASETISAFAHCLDVIAAEIADGNFRFHYDGCVDFHLGGQRQSGPDVEPGLAIITAGGLSDPFLALMTEREIAFGILADAINSASGDDHAIAVGAYEIALTETADDLRAIAEVE